MSPQNSKTIMIVDDDEDVRDIMHTILKKQGYRTILASNGKEALKLFDKSYDLIITDIRMPEMDGIELINRLNSQNYNKFLLVTAFSTKKIPEVPFVNKPFRIRKFIETVYQLCDGEE